MIEIPSYPDLLFSVRCDIHGSFFSLCSCIDQSARGRWSVRKGKKEDELKPPKYSPDRAGTMSHKSELSPYAMFELRGLWDSFKMLLVPCESKRQNYLQFHRPKSMKRRVIPEHGVTHFSCSSIIIKVEKEDKSLYTVSMRTIEMTVVSTSTNSF